MVFKLNMSLTKIYIKPLNYLTCFEFFRKYVKQRMTYSNSNVFQYPNKILTDTGFRHNLHRISLLENSGSENCWEHTVFFFPAIFNSVLWTNWWPCSENIYRCWCHVVIFFLEEDSFSFNFCQKCLNKIKSPCTIKRYERPGFESAWHIAGFYIFQFEIWIYLSHSPSESLRGATEEKKI